jgi:hypothetical protein
MPRKPNSFMNWLGRQFGHVKKAVKTDVPEVVYKKTTVQEAQLPDRPNETLRRTTVDEVIKLEQKN